MKMLTQLPVPVTPFNIQAVMADQAILNQRWHILMNRSCLRMRGLPFSAVQHDILNFLSNYVEYVIGTVHIISNLQGRPSGEAFVQLQSPELAYKCANELHLKHMGERYIEVFQCTVKDMTWMLATSHANRFAAKHFTHLSGSNTKNNNSKNNNNFNNMYHHNPPSPPLLPTHQGPPMDGLLVAPPPPPPTLTTNGFIPQNIHSLPIFTNQGPPILYTVPGYYIPPHHMQPTHNIPAPCPAPQLVQADMGPTIYNSNSIHFQVNGISYITFTGSPPDEAMTTFKGNKQLTTLQGTGN